MTAEKSRRGEIVALAREGKTNPEIAAATGIPLRTVQVATKAAREAGDIPPPAGKETVMSTDTNEPERRELRIDQIRVDHGINPRAELSKEGVVQYAEYYRWYAGLSPVQEALIPPEDRMPDPVVFFDGKVYWLSSGFHRVAGAGTGTEGVSGAGMVTIRCAVYRGTRRDAMVYALSQNARNGVQRTRADLARAVEIAMSDDVLKTKSNRELGKILRCNESVFRKRKQADDKPAPAPPPAGKAKPQEAKPAAKGGAAQPHPSPAPSPPPGQGFVSPPAPAAPPEVTIPRDKLGRPVPPHLEPVFGHAAAMEDAAKKYGSAAHTLKKLDADPAVGNFLRTRPHLEADSRSLAAFVRRNLSPYCVCPACDGVGDRGQCPSCGGRGWLTRAGFDGLAPEMREQAKSFRPGDAWEGDTQEAADELAASAADPQRYQPAGPGLDPTGKLIPAELRDLFQADFLTESCRELDRLMTALQGAKSWLVWLRPEVLQSLADTARGIRDAIPYAVHRPCKGKGCADCMMSGYLPKWRFDHEEAKRKENKT